MIVQDCYESMDEYVPQQLTLSSEAPSLGIIKAIESGRMRSAGYVASIGKLISPSSIPVVLTVSQE